jgi:hypothetical protein
MRKKQNSLFGATYASILRIDTIPCDHELMQLGNILRGIRQIPFSETQL